MRPKSPVLRYAFRAAKAKLESEDKKITIRTLADEMKANFKTVQRFLYRERDLAAEIGIELAHAMHGVGEYAKAIVNIPADQRPTSRRIANALHLDPSSVVKFLKVHPELRALHSRFDKVKDEKLIEVKSELPTPRWRDLGIAVWHENAGRYVGVSATRHEYLDYWRKGLIKHQCEKQPKPGHLPTPDEVSRMS